MEKGSPRDQEKSLEQRVEELETSLAYQDKLVAELNGVVTAQQRTIDTLSSQVKEMSKQLREIRERGAQGGIEAGVSEKPPHY